MCAQTTKQKLIWCVSRIHPYTILVLFFLVLLPWLLIAIPGARPANESGREIPQLPPGNQFFLPMKHGWPATHLVSTKHNLPNLDIDASLQAYTTPSDLIAISPRREFVEDLKATGGFWSDRNRWPTRNSHELPNGNGNLVSEYNVVWTGLLINLGFLAVALVAVGLFCEYRIKRLGRIKRQRTRFRFSLFNFMTLFIGISLLMGWAGMHSHRAVTEDVELTRLEICLLELEQQNCSFQYEVFKCDVLPTCVSRLFNYGLQIPFLHHSTFQRISKVKIYPSYEITYGDAEAHKLAREKLSGIDLPFHWHILFPQHIYLPAVSNTVGLDLKNRSNLYRAGESNSLLTDLSWLDRFENLEYLTIELQVGFLKPDTRLQWQVIDELPRIKQCVASLRFSAREERFQTPHLNTVMELENMNELVFHDLGEEGAFCLQRMPKSGKRVFINESSIHPRIRERICEKLFKSGCMGELAEKLHRQGL